MQFYNFFLKKVRKREEVAKRAEADAAKRRAEDETLRQQERLLQKAQEVLDLFLK
jgi:hypothetical protein